LARRVSLPTADDLFRPTAESEVAGDEEQPDERPAAPRRTQSRTQGRSPDRAQKQRAVAAVPEPAPSDETNRRTSGRVRHDEKMTVYVTADELVDIEHARLSLRRDHGLAVDRGRLVREALAIVLADLEEQGDDSELVRRLIR
jgi:hypothetical protein